MHYRVTFYWPDCCPCYRQKIFALTFLGSLACAQMPTHSELYLVYRSLQSRSCHFGHAFSPSVAVHNVAKLCSAAPLSVLDMSCSRYRWTYPCKMTLMQITCSFRNPNNTEVCKKIKALSDQHCQTTDVLGNVSQNGTDQEKSSFWNMAIVWPLLIM